jgi:hypothetical protein
MKKITTAVMAFGAAMMIVTSSAAQTDTVVIKETETVVVHDTVVKEEPKRAEPLLRRLELGIRYLPTFSSLALRTYGGETVEGELVMSHGFGVMLGVNLSRHVGLQGEVNYYEVSQKYKDQSLERQVNVSFLNIPVLLSLNTDKSQMLNFKIEAGPQFGLNVGSSVETRGNRNADTLRAVVGVKEGDVGAAYGAGLDIMLNAQRTVRLDLGFRGFYGLVDMNADQSSNNPDTYNVLIKASRKTYSGYAGLTFLF